MKPREEPTSESIKEAQEISFLITPDGEFIFPWWNPLAQEIIDTIDGEVIDDQSSNLCG